MGVVCDVVVYLCTKGRKRDGIIVGANSFMELTRAESKHYFTVSIDFSLREKVL